MPILVALVKGCLDHRLDKLGGESSDQAEFQQALYHIGEAQGFVNVKRSIMTGAPQPERPLWAGGAMIYCHPLHADALKAFLYPRNGMVNEEFGSLESKYIVFSAELWPLIKEALSHIPDHRNCQECYQHQRAGNLSRLYEWGLETYFLLDAGVWDARDDLDEDTLEHL